MKNKIIILNILFFLPFGLQLKAQIKDYQIFARIATVDNDTLAGYINWNNKIYWTDFFQAAKTTNAYAHYFNPKDRIEFLNNGFVYHQPMPQNFRCRFGNIEKIYPTGSNKINLQFKGGSTIELKNGESNDIGFPINLFNGKENINVKWDQISEIEFKLSNLPVNETFRNPITGVVKGRQGIYKGLTTWNNKKTIKSSLTGLSSPGEISISFEQINKVENQKKQLNIIKKDGEEIKVWRKNDSETWSLSINMPNTGNVRIPLDDFEFFESCPLDGVNILSYDDFKNVSRLEGEVITKNGSVISGFLGYNLNQATNAEVLSGRNNNIIYQIPFKYIRSIEPKNYKYSFVILQNGTSMSLGESQDVNSDNNGVIVFSEESVPVYIPWQEIKKITLKGNAL